MSAPLPLCFLFDNGSLRAASTASLRRTAAALQTALGQPVEAVSLLHSSGVDPAELGGVPARLVEPALVAALEQAPDATVVLLPFFFGPSGALTEYLPGRLASVAARFPKSTIRLGLPLVGPGANDFRVVDALVDAARRTIERNRLVGPRVVLVDHGSPQRAVAEVRDWLGTEVRARLGREVSAFAVASMERRPQPEYAFNEPLLERLLGRAPFDEGDVVVLLQFLSPGRHAGDGGDIEEICARARTERPGLRTYLTEPIAQDPRVVEVLVQRFREAAGG